MNVIGYETLETEVDWEQRRYEISKNFLPKAHEIVMNALNENCKIEKWKGKTIAECTAEQAVCFAEVLIEELKKTK